MVETHRTYDFSTFDANGDSDDYFVYDCDCEGYRSAPGVPDWADPAASR